MKKIFFSVLAISTLFLTSCKDDDDKEDTHAHVSFALNHSVGTDELEYDTMKYVNAAGHKYEVQTLKYFISNISLNKSDGSKVKLDGPFYVDAEVPSTLTIDEHTDITSGDYNSISLTFGLDSITNNTVTLTSTEEVAMAWPTQMGGGYHYMKFEGQYDSLQKNVIKNFKVHTGATMGTPYHVDIEIPNSNFTVGSSDVKVNLIMDLNQWFTNPNDYDFSDYGAGIMMDMQAQMVLKANGPSVYSASVE